MVSERELFVSEKKSVDAFAASDCNFNSEAKSFTFAGSELPVEGSSHCGGREHG